MSLVIILTTLRDVATYVNFYVYQDYISEFLCTNKNKPELNCKGKCVLRKALVKNQEDKQNNLPHSQQEDRTVYLFPTLTPLLSFLELENFNEEIVSYWHETYSSDYLSEVFHPPA